MQAPAAANILLVSSAQGATLEAGGGNIEVRQCGGRPESLNRGRQHRTG